MEVQRILTEKYGFSSEAAAEATQKFLNNFRRCPENPDFHLDDWRRSLWGISLGKNHMNITGEVYLQWLDLRFKYLAPSAEVISLLESLQKSYRLAVITNGPSNAQWEKMKRLRLTQYFQLILVSGDVKLEKPDENIFLQACLCLGVLPEECVMVGDKLETDILGGIRAQLGGTVWMRDPDATAGDGVSRTLAIAQTNDPFFERMTVKVVPDCVAHNFNELHCFLSSEFQRTTRPSLPEERNVENSGRDIGNTR